MIAFILIAAYLVICLITGFISANKIQTLKQFAIGSRATNMGVLFITIYSAYLGGGNTLGLIERINNIGLICAIMAVVSLYNWDITKAVICSNIHKFHGCLSQPQVMEKIYGELGLWVSTIVTMILSICMVAIQILIIGFMVQHFFTLPLPVGVALGAGVIIVYAAIGGLKANPLSDMMQILAITTLLLLLIILCQLKLSTFSTPLDFFHSIAKSKSWIIPHDGHSVLLIMGMLVYALTPIGLKAPFMERFLFNGLVSESCKVIPMLKGVDFAVVFLIAGIAVLLLPTTGDATLSTLGILKIISDLPTALMATMMIGIVATILTTADCWLNSTSIAISNGVVKRLIPSLTDVEEVMVARLVTLVLGVMAACLALSGDDILSLLLLGANFHDPIILMPIVAGFLGWNCNLIDFKRSIAGAIIGILLGCYIEGGLGFISLLLGSIGSAIALLGSIGSNIMGPEDKDILTVLTKVPPINQVFFMLIAVLSTVGVMIHLYIAPTWVTADFTNAGCLIISGFGLYLCLLNITEGKVFRHCADLSSMLLIASVSSLAFRTCDYIAISHLIISICVVSLYRASFAAVLGLSFGLISIKCLQVIAHTSPISLGMLVLYLLALPLLCLYIYYRELAILIRKAHLLSITDRLTKLYTRRYFDMNAVGVLQTAVEGKKALSMIMIDIDRFKQINKIYGYDAGNEILQAVAQSLRGSVRRASDIYVRYSGEKIVVILPTADLKQVKIIGKRICENVAQAPFYITPINPLLTRVECTVSIGATTLREADTPELMVERARAALRLAKRRGRNKVVAMPEKK